MKIIYLHQYFNTPEMSGGTRSYEMARRMVSAGHEVHLITSDRAINKKPVGWYTTNESGVNVHWYPVPYSNHMSYRQRIYAFFAFALASRRKAAELDGDVIFATSTPLTIALPAVSAARKKKIPMVFEVRDLWPEMPIAIGALRNPMLCFLARKLEVWAYNNSSAVVALSPGMKEGVVCAGYSAERIAVIPNGSDNVEFKFDAKAAERFKNERAWLDDKPLLVYTGTFGKVNGVGYMIDLAEELLAIESDIRILLIGDGAEWECLVNAAKRKGVFENNLFIEKSLPKKDMSALLGAATMASNLVIDLPQARANSANKFFDTLAAGKPILLNHGGWMHDLVQLRECGLTMWQRSISDVAVELERKMHDVNWLASAGAAARKLAEDYFDRDVLANQLMSVLEVVAEGDVDKVESIAPGLYL
ncbi:glycosyltransferase family 4 protein [Zobellella sp. An-6]|uniref:glycosyltransferase family 4 protein n=1 Tax=Zobellella sp. An-6 TaxID=3400218 RepID=UPI0040425E64